MQSDDLENYTKRFEDAPISKLFGFEVEPGEPGTSVVHLQIDERLHNSMGRVHGGVLATLADAAMGIAFGRTMDEGRDFATIDLHIHFMRPVRGKRITARGELIQRGLRIGFLQCQIFDDRNRLIATSTCSCTVLQKDMA